jgi:ABC-2 type transport system permease protein
MTDTDAMGEDFDARPKAAPAAVNETRPFYWSVRRELWENRSIYIAPLVAAGVVLLGFMIGLAYTPPRMRAMALDPLRRHHMHAVPYDVAAVVVMVTGFIVAVFYCLGALHGERRDRSILFWKSLPVSDTTTVLSKAAIPMAVMPVVIFVVALALQVILLLVNTMATAAAGHSVSELWADVPLVSMSGTMIWGLFTLALWYAPIWGWLLMVSAWARRMTFLWAVAPPLAVCVVEKLAFDTSYFASMLKYRLGGGFEAAFTAAEHGRRVIGVQPQIDPVGFVTTIGVWVGLAFGAAFLAAAVWLRRYREPI